MRRMQSSQNNLRKTKQESSVRYRKFRFEPLESRQMLTAAGWDITSAAETAAPLNSASETIEIPITGAPTPTPTPKTLNWSTAGLRYTDYQLVISEKSTLSLNGCDGGKWVTLEKSSFDRQTELYLTGACLKKENLFIDAKVMTGLSLIQYDSGLLKQDKIVITGTDKPDEYSLSTEIRFLRIFDKVTLKDGAKLTFAGVSDITIDAGSGNDTFNIETYTVRYNLIGGGGEDTLNFSGISCCSHVNLNLGSTSRQTAVTGLIGSLTLNRDIERLIGSSQCDTITAFDTTTYIDGNGGSDRVTLNGTSSTRTELNLTGKNQNVTANGSGTYDIRITDGTGSNIRAASVKGAGSLKLTAEGDRITVNGSSGADTITVTGDNASIRSNDGNDTIKVTGSSASVYGGKGSDTITIERAKGRTSGRVTVNGEDGDDFIDLHNTDGANTVNAGAGNDIVFGGIGSDSITSQRGNSILIGNSGADSLTGGSGQDILIANLTSGLSGKSEKEQRKILDDVYKIWTDGALSASAKITQVTDPKRLGDQSSFDSAKDRINRGSGAGNLIYNNTVEGDTNNGRAANPYNDVVIDTKYN